MEIILKVNNIDRTNEIVIDSLEKNDVINSEKDTLNFRVLKYGERGFVPEINQEVELTIDGEKEFGGVIVEVKKSVQEGNVAAYEVVCCDYSQFLDRRLVLERYDDETIENIIKDIIDKYAEGFTYNNVSCDTVVKTMLFNRLTVSACLDRLAEAVNYSWYVDYEKDIHFFPRNENPAPFSITDTNGSYLQGTLEISDDLSQIRNKVVIRGGEERGVLRTERYIADGDQTNFPLAHKFATIPTVKVNSVEKTVGIDFLHAEENYDCFWNYQQKYVRFKDSTKPSSGQTVEISGEPLFPILVNVIDGLSIEKYGIYEFFKEDKNITSRAEALRYAKAELQAYKDGVREGKFVTNRAGLRSGQIINVNSEILGINEDFLIQRISFKLLSKDRGEWAVELATMRTIGIIQVLQDLIKFREIRDFDPDNLLSLLNLADSFSVSDALKPGDEWVVTTPPYYWQGASGIEYPPPVKWNFFTWSS